MNKVVLMGRLTADPDIRYTQDGKAVASYTLAVDRRSSKQDQKADFIRCQAWEKNAEVAEKYFAKGTKLVITGRIATGNYKDKDGKTVYTTDVIVEDQEFAEIKTGTDKGSSKKAEKETPANDGFLSVNDIDESLPFN